MKIYKLLWVWINEGWINWGSDNRGCTVLALLSTSSIVIIHYFYLSLLSATVFLYSQVCGHFPLEVETLPWISNFEFTSELCVCACMWRGYVCAWHGLVWVLVCVVCACVSLHSSIRLVGYPHAKYKSLHSSIRLVGYPHAKYKQCLSVLRQSTIN